MDSVGIEKWWPPNWKDYSGQRLFPPLMSNNQVARARLTRKQKLNAKRRTIERAKR